MTLIAGIDAENEKSIALHENYGFVHAGTIKKAGYKFNRWLDLAFYQLELNGPKKAYGRVNVCVMRIMYFRKIVWENFMLSFLLYG